MKTPYKPLETLLEEYGEIIRPIKGISMLPMLREDRDAVRLVPVKEDLKVGDVPLYRKTNGQYVLHRIVSVEQKHYIIRGDNCVTFEKVSKKRVVGVAGGFFRDGKYVSTDDVEYQKYVATVLAEGKPLIPREWRYLLKLYAAAITQTQPPEAPEDLDWLSLLQKSNKQLITAVVASAVEMLESPPPAKIFEAFVKARYAALRRDILFDAEREKIYSIFRAEKIPYASLKGIIIKDMYPARGVREFVDNDILIDPSRANDVRRIMKDLGYKAIAGDEIHDTYHKDNLYCFEMHRRLYEIRRDKKNRDMWKYFLPDSEGSLSHHMRDEDLYVYLVAHYAKHCREGGAGARFLGDFYLIRKKFFDSPDFDRAYVKEQLISFGVEDAEETIAENVRMLFVEGALSDNAIRECFVGGSHGSYARKIALGIQSEGKLKYIIKKLFPPFSLMVFRYRILRKMPFLLPFFWPVRWFQYFLDTDGRRRGIHMLKLWVKTEDARKEQ